MHTLLILLRKEFIQFRRNKLMPRIAFGFPFMVLLIMPLVATMDVKHVQVAVVDHDGSLLSRRICSAMDASPLFTIATTRSFAEAMARVEAGESDVVLTIPPDFERRMSIGELAFPDIQANGVNGIKGSIGASYVMAALTSMTLDADSQPSVIHCFNPTLDYRWFMIPALMIMLLIMICGFLPALNLAGEKEIGTIEQINVTAVSPITFILSKLIPYWIIGVVVLTIGLIVSATVYNLQPAGPLAAIYLAAALFIMVMSGIGVLIANFSSTMTRSMFLMLFIVLVFVLMSGLLTPIESMPQWAQWVTYAVPPRYFIEIMRSVYLKGTSMAALWPDYLALLLSSILCGLLAAATYRKVS